MASSSSSTVDEHQVFIQFHGSGLGFGFVSHLLTALKHHNINAFINDFEDIRKAKSKSRILFLLDRITKSKVVLCIFSSDYAELDWPLLELWITSKCVKQGQLVAIPIFYKVEPSTVRDLTGEFGDAFRKPKNVAHEKKWKEALKSISNLMGIIVHEKSYEASAINEIVDNVQKVLRNESNPRLGGKVLLKTQVFINFRGDELRNNFVGYLVDALQKREVNVFADNYLQIGDDLTELFKKIEDSGIAVVVFSSRYTQSKWCLDELDKIKERVSQDKLKVIPVFYKVTPTDVKRLKGKFGEYFRDQEWRFESDEPKIKRWKEAIKFVSHKFALTFDDKSSALEIVFVGDVVREVLKTLETISTGGNTLQLSFV